MLLGVETDDEGGDIDDLLADAIMIIKSQGDQCIVAVNIIELMLISSTHSSWSWLKKKTIQMFKIERKKTLSPTYRM